MNPSNESAAAAAPVFTMSRVFAKPREQLFAAYTEERHLKRWFGPKGFTVFACRLDLWPGGIFHYGLRAPDGGEMRGKWVFREIAAPERLAVVVSFSDADGGVTRHPMAPQWPLETLSETRFSESDGRTTLSLRWSPFNTSAEERAAFAAGFDGMRQGCAGMFDQLDAYLATL
jgi:uncharacterized protein YndB with AHSA1/START domain